MVDKALTENIGHDHYCSCGHAMCDTEELYSEVYEEMVQLWECPACYRSEEEVL